MQEIELSKIEYNPRNPRKKFKGREFDDFVASIKQKGILQPILLRPHDPQKTDNGHYQIVCGERRYRAILQISKENGNLTIPATVKEMTDDEAFDAMMIENILRENLTDLEEARSFSKYMKNGGDIEELAGRTGMQPGYIRKRIKIMELSKPILSAWSKGDLKFGHLEQLIRVTDKDDRNLLADKTIDYEYSVSNLKNEIDYNAPELSKAVFNQVECNTCPDNTAKQRTLFDLDLDKKALCLKSKCFKDKLLDHFTLKWPEIKKKDKLSTNNFAFNFNLNYGDYQSYSGSLMAGCAKCEKYATIITAEGKINNKRACLDRACYEKKVSEKKGKATPDTTIDTTKADKAKVRSIKHGELFREDFYKEAIPQKYETVDDEKIDRLSLFAFLQTGDFNMQQWFYQKYQTKPETKTFELLCNMDHKKIKEVSKELSIHQIMGHSCFATDRRNIADHIGIDLTKEWTITEDYLKAKHKDELVEIVKKFKLVDKNSIEDFKCMKKPAMIDKIMAQDTKNVVPKEILV